jgi:hypothetical protein
MILVGRVRVELEHATWGVHRTCDGSPLGALLGRRVGAFAGLFEFLTASWQMYFVGFLFGLGFDTASEVPCWRFLLEPQLKAFRSSRSCRFR